MHETRVFEFLVATEPSLVRLDAQVSMRIGRLSRRKAAVLIRRGAVRVNGQTSRPSYRLRRGDRVTVEMVERRPDPIPAEEAPLDVLFEDVHLLVVSKPAGVAQHPHHRHLGGTLANALLHHLHGPGSHDRGPLFVHRLDRYTSGAVVVARTKEAQIHLLRQFEERAVTKRYLAIVEGYPPDRGTIEAPLAFDPQDSRRVRVAEGGKSALTRFSVLRRLGGGLSLLEVEPVSGRTHQIRVHLAWAGHPILCDDFYGRRKRFEPGASGVALVRQALHAASVALWHPASGLRIEVGAPLPDDLAWILEAPR